MMYLNIYQKHFQILNTIIVDDIIFILILFNDYTCIFDYIYQVLKLRLN